jgi:sterol desaturase/sphingolipid hydroxylase (fatty acid hydroxylase superfamily)
MLILQHAFPRRAQRLAWRRWPSNFGLVVISSLLVRLLVPTAAIGVALYAESQGLGLLRWLGVNEFLGGVLAVLLLDMLIYFQHRVFHALPILWRLHRVHHADTELDASSGLRFHPIEIMLSMGIKMAAVVVLGAPAEAVLVFEVLLNATALFNHSNLALPLWLDRVLRWVLVTPDMHRVHHSVVRAETDSNFGFCLSVWDRIFGTHIPEPAAGQLGSPSAEGCDSVSSLCPATRPIPPASAFPHAAPVPPGAIHRRKARCRFQALPHNPLAGPPRAWPLPPPYDHTPRAGFRR